MWGSDFFSLKGIIEFVRLSIGTVEKVSKLYRGNRRDLVVRKLHEMYATPSETIAMLEALEQGGNMHVLVMDEFQERIISTEPIARDAIDYIDKLVKDRSPKFSLKEKRFLDEAVRAKTSVREQLARMFYFRRDGGLSRWELEEIRELVSLLNKLNQTLEEAENQILNRN